VSAEHLFRRMFDDAAMFPPGNAPIESAVAAHRGMRHSAAADYVGPLITPLSRVVRAAELWPTGETTQLEVALTLVGDPAEFPPGLQAALALQQLHVVAVEVAVPSDVSASTAVATIDAAVPEAVKVFAEVPRDARRHDFLKLLSGTRLRAKFRTGGTVADAYPPESELAEAICLSVQYGLPFKATAGLHGAVRNTQPTTGFEQHGFLNIIMAVTTSAAGSSTTDVEEVLRCRDEDALSRSIAALSADEVTRVRDTFVSFGTCSIAEPLGDLARLNLVAPVVEHDGRR
jgi:hypothetical protein